MSPRAHHPDGRGGPRGPKRGLPPAPEGGVSPVASLQTPGGGGRTETSAVVPEAMRRALQAARWGIGRVSPNPIVGACLHLPGRPLVAEYHRRFGGPHAEAALLDRVARDSSLPRGAVLYVTLEPCCHTGKTPPCVDRILAARPERVVVACLDPDPRVRGRGVARLRAAGIEVEVGPGETAALRQNLPFHLRHQTGRALVTLKLASTLDARLVIAGGRTRWITGPEARRQVHLERARCDAVLVGADTVLADAPRLTVRDARGADPSRIVVDSGLRVPVRGRLWQEWRDRGALPCDGPPPERAGNWARLPGRTGARWRRAPRLILATRPGADPHRVEAFRAAGWDVWMLRGSNGHVGLRGLLTRAAREGFLEVLAEAGPTLAGALLANDLVDRLSLYTALRVSGGPAVWPPASAPALPGAGRPFVLRDRRRLGEDLWTSLERAGRLEEARNISGRPGRA